MKLHREDDFETILEEERLILDVTELIHRLMDEQDVSRVELARRLNATKGHVSQLLDGKRNMTLRTMTRITRALGHRARVTTEPIGLRMTTPQPRETHNLHCYFALGTTAIPNRFAVFSSNLTRFDFPPTTTDIDEEFQELLAASAA